MFRNICRCVGSDLTLSEIRKEASALRPPPFAALLIVFLLLASSARAQSTPSLNLEGTGDLGPGPGACVPAGCSGLFTATVSGQLAGAVSASALQMNLQVENRFVCTCGPPTAVPCPLAVPCPTPVVGTGLAGTASPKTSVKNGGGHPNIEAQIAALQEQAQSLQQQMNALMTGGVVFPLPAGCLPATGSGTFSGTQYTVNFNGELCSDNANNLVLSGAVSIVQSPLSAGLVTWATGTLVASGSIHIPAPPTGNPIPISGPMVVSIVGAVGEIPGLVP
jgi:hypothetical protein